MIILGIDPGLSGALALYNTSDQTVEVFDMPVLELVRNGKKKGEVSAQALARQRNSSARKRNIGTFQLDHGCNKSNPLKSTNLPAHFCHRQVFAPRRNS